MNLETTKSAYIKILKLMKKYKDVCIFDINELESKSNLHLFGLELNELYGLNIDPKSIYRTDWIDCGDYIKIGRYGEKYNRKISWPDDGTQPIDEMLVRISFPSGPHIFSDLRLSTDYPLIFFNKFWLELKTYNPDYIDTHNHSMYWKLSNAKEIFNSFNNILDKYNKLNDDDKKQRKIQKIKEELEKLQNE